jgi:hypothetical protein
LTKIEYPFANQEGTVAERKKAARPAARGASRKVSRATSVSSEQRQQMIARAAYLRAERRGFAPGAEMQDWLEAEAEVDQRLGAR